MTNCTYYDISAFIEDSQLKFINYRTAACLLVVELLRTLRSLYLNWIRLIKFNT